MAKKETICEVECPECGDILYFYEIGLLHCGCGGAVGELSVNFEIIEEEE